MPGFYYWFPENLESIVDERAGKLKVEAFDKYECAYLFQDRDRYPDQVTVHRSEGPGGMAGLMVYPRPVDKKAELPRCVFHPQDQQWVRFKGYWIGIDKGNLPKPADLERKVPISWYDVEDAQGETWKAPIIRRKQGGTFLPTLSTFDESGQFVSTIDPSAQTFWDLSGTALDYMHAKKPYTDEDINRMTVAFLSVNYFLGIPEIHAWGTFGKVFLETTFVAQVIASATDYARVEDFEEQKKTPDIS